MLDDARSGSWATGLDTERYGLPIIRIGNDMWRYRKLAVKRRSGRESLGRETPKPRMCVGRNRDQPWSYRYCRLTFRIADKDVSNLSVVVHPSADLTGEIAWDVTNPAPQVEVLMMLYPLAGAAVSSVRAAAPGSFKIEGIPPQDYEVRAYARPPGFDMKTTSFYVKEVTYGGASVLHELMHMGAAMGNDGLHVSVASDGASLSGRLADRDGSGVQDSYIVLLPAAAETASAIAKSILTTDTDQNGAFGWDTLPPGKYLAMAMHTAPVLTPEFMARVIQMRSEATPVEPGAQ